MTELQTLAAAGHTPAPQAELQPIAYVKRITEAELRTITVI